MRELLHPGEQLALSDAEVSARYGEIVSNLGSSALASPEHTQQRRIEGHMARYWHLYRAEHSGMTTTERFHMMDVITDIGLPVDNIRSLAHRPLFGEEKKEDKWRTLATWHQEEGEFTTYDKLRELPEAAYLATTIHELTHAASPMRPENDFMYGSRENRQEAARFAIQAGRQALDTNLYLNGYHEKLATELKTGEISEARYYEEFSAILAELSLTNRAHVRQVEISQHKKLDRIAETYGMKAHKIHLISAPDSEVAVGIDRTLLNLVEMSGPRNPRGIEMHVENLKRKYSDPEDAAKVVDRIDKEFHRHHDCRQHQTLDLAFKAAA